MKAAPQVAFHFDYHHFKFLGDELLFSISIAQAERDGPASTLRDYRSSWGNTHDKMWKPNPNLVLSAAKTICKSVQDYYDQKEMPGNVKKNYYKFRGALECIDAKSR